MKFTEKRIREAIRQEVNLTIASNLERAIEKGIINALKCFGADVENQHEVQRDFHYLRKLRKRAEESGHMLMRGVISASIAATAVALWEGIKIILQS